MDNRPIGIFDSGLGGLTVLKEVLKLLPGENVVYFGDCGRVPYGTKSKETIVKYSFQDIRFLLTQDVKMIVVACNTISACSIEEIRREFDTDVIEVVGPGAAGAVKATSGKKIGIIGTQATVNSRVYEKAITGIDKDIRTYSAACPLFVPLVEEGWWEKNITLEVAKEYLLPLKAEQIDTLVLACTHYPLLEKVIRTVMGDGVKLVNSATEAAHAVKDYLDRQDAKRDESLGLPEYRFYTSDSADKFKVLGSLFLDRIIDFVEKIDIERY